MRKPRKEAVLKVERLAEAKIRQRAHRARLKAVRKEAEEGRKRQAELFRKIGVPDPSPQEVTERARRRAYR